MIMATVVVMAVVINTTQSLIRLNPQATAGFEMRVESTLLSFFNPIEDIEAAIAARADDPLLAEVAAVGRLTDQLMGAHVAGSDRADRNIMMTGVNQGFVDQASKIYSFQARAPGYESDEAIWNALATRDNVVVVKPRVMTAPVLPFGMRAPTDAELNSMPIDEEDDEFGPPADRPRGPSRVFGRFTLDAVKMSAGKLPEVGLELTTAGQDGVTRTITVEVIGVLADDTNLAEGNMLASEATLRRLRSVPVTGDATYIKVKEGADPRAVAAGIEGSFVSTALNTSLIEDEYAQRQRLTGGALQLLQGFMALGLLVGIAALGVISTRAVIERRQQVGMLRAMGYQKGMVGLSFLLESSFISITGLLLGALTGVVLGNNMISAFFPQLDHSVVDIPWTQIGLIVLAAYLFSLLTTILPAWQAARIYPAEALRYE
ncbi:MAG: ABC transporter permease [Anaerolineales bacterium]|nr:ABC transporter permease [Anaerolineales bacterium]